VFSQQNVKELFKKFVTVRLHTDKDPADGKQVPDARGATQLRDVKFKNFALPYYVIVRVKGKTLERVGTFSKGVIDDPAEFTTFLEDALKAQ
jgi:hypothetical protein